MTRCRWHQGVFLAAGLYNLAWGGLAALDPQWFFRYAGLAPLNHPEVFACLGMVLGLYGILYLEVARHPTQGRPIALVGLLGKMLGPVGAVVLIARGVWPAKAIVLCVTNDFLWWLPFGLYLYDARGYGTVMVARAGSAPLAPLVRPPAPAPGAPSPPGPDRRGS